MQLRRAIVPRLWGRLLRYFFSQHLQKSLTLSLVQRLGQQTAKVFEIFPVDEALHGVAPRRNYRGQSCAACDAESTEHFA